MHHLLEQILDEDHCRRRPPEWPTSVPEPQFGWNGVDQDELLTGTTPGLRLKNVTAAGFLTPGGFQHLVADRNHDLSGK